MEIRPLKREELVRENGADGKRLLPWAALNAPFEGAWVVLEAGGETGAHSHHDYEIFIVMTGVAEVETGGTRYDLEPGSIVHFPPYTEHRVINKSPDEEFQWYSIWWDQEMSARFTERHDVLTAKA
jgi:mannose-6-phosphate isomerase-like protein (cupin superfamily)